MAQDTRLPSADGATSGNFGPTGITTKYNLVNEASPDDDTTWFAMSSTNAVQIFTFSPFSVPVNSSVNWLQILYRHKKIASAAANIRSVLIVGSSQFYAADGGANPANGTWNTSGFTTSNNPKTGVGWTVDDINSVGVNGFQGFGVRATDATPATYCTWIQAVVDYTPALQQTAQEAFDYGSFRGVMRGSY